MRGWGHLPKAIAGAATGEEVKAVVAGNYQGAKALLRENGQFLGTIAEESKESEGIDGVGLEQ